MSSAALRTDRVPEAIRCAAECLKIHSPSRNHGKGALFLERAISLAQIFAAASLTSSTDVAIVFANEAEGIFRYLFKIRPDVVALPFADYLHSVADFHFRHSHPNLALAASSECIRLYGRVPFVSERHGLHLAHAFADHSRYAADLKEWSESISAEESVLHQLRLLNAANPHAHDHRIFRASMNLRQRLKLSGDNFRALECMRELELFIRDLIDPFSPRIDNSSLELLADVTSHHGLDAAALSLWDEATDAFDESVSIHEKLGHPAESAPSILELSKCTLQSGGDGDDVLELSRRAVDAARLALDSASSTSPIGLIGALSHHAWALFLFYPSTTSDAIAAEENNLAICTEFAMVESERPVYDISPESTARMLASLAHLYVYLSHVGRWDDASVAINRIKSTFQTTAPHIVGLVEAVENEVIGRLKEETKTLVTDTRTDDIQAYLDVVSALEAIVAEVDTAELAQRAARARLSERIIARNDRDTQSDDDTMIRQALSTMTLDTGETGLHDGQVLDSLPGF